jgi:hypothetical protein
VVSRGLKESGTDGKSRTHWKLKIRTNFQFGNGKKILLGGYRGLNKLLKICDELELKHYNSSLLPLNYITSILIISMLNTCMSANCTKRTLRFKPFKNLKNNLNRMQ